MKPNPDDPTAATEQKIAALVEQLRQAERELQELTGGQLDAIAAHEGGPILLREAQEHLRLQATAQRQAAEMQIAILNALPAHIALLDSQGVILAVNEAWRRFASANILQSDDFFIGQNYLSVCEQAHGECSEEAQEAADGIRRVLRGEVPEFSLEYPCHSPTEKRWFRLMVTPLSELPGQGVVVMHVNVTARKLAEETLRENQARLEAEARRLRDSQAVAQVGSWETDLDTLEVTWTAETHRIFETDPAIFFPTHGGFLERVHPADCVAVDTAFKESLGKPGPFAIDHRVMMPDGRIKFVEERWQTFHNDAGKPARAVGTCQDITERKQAEELIQTRARQQEAIAKLGFEATRATSLESIFEITVRMVASALDVELCKVLQLSPDGSELRLVSGIGWNPGLVGTASVAVDFESQAGYTLQMGGPVYVNDFSLETRFKAPPLLREHAVTSGLSVTIMLRDKPWGVLGAHCRTIRRFNEEDAHFMQSVATLLSVVVERLAVQRSLSESDRRMRDAQRLANLGNWEIDLLNSRLAWSDEVFRIFGTKSEDFPETYEAFMALVHPEDRRKVEAAQEIALSGIGPLEVEHRILRPDGSLRHVRQRGEIIQDEAGNAVALSGTVLDITDLRTAQSRAEKMTALLAEAQSMADMGSWDMDVVTSRLTWSEDTCRLFGIEQDAFGGTYQSLVAFLLPEDLPEFDAAHERALENGGILETEYRIRRADGEVRWMFERGRLIFDSAGAVTRRMGVVMDITERKRLELVQVWETQVLEAVSAGQPLPAILDRIAEGVADAIPGAMVSILLLDEDGRHLRHGAAPALPEAYNRAIDGVEVGPAVGSCGTAMHRREAVYVTDIRTDPLWVNFRELAESHGLRACWSLPVLNAAGQPLASFAVYYREPREPRPGDIELIKRTVHITGIAVERVRKEKELRLLEACVSRLNDIVLITDAEPIDEPGPRILFVNDAFVRRTGYTREEVIGKSPRFLQGPKTQRDALDRIRAALKAWKPVREQLINYTKSGEEFWLELDIVPIADASGWFTHWVSIERDITKRKKAEEALRLSEERFRLMIEGSEQVLFYTHDREHRFEYLSPSTLAVLGYEPEELVGKPCELLIIPDDAVNDRVHELTEKALQDGKPTEPYLAAVRHKDGRRIVIEILESPLIQDGNVVGIQGFARDITARETARATLETSEARFRSLFDQAAVGMCLASTEGRFLRTNQRFCEIVGYSAEEMLNRSCAQTTHPDDREHEGVMVSRMLSGEIQSAAWEKRYLHKDGHAVWCNLTLSLLPVMDGQGRQFVAVIEDITERRTAVEQLRNRESLLRIAGSIAHLGGWSVKLPDVKITWSDEVCAIHDMPAGTVPTLEQAIGFYTPESRPVVEQAFEACARDGTPFDLELELVTAAGRTIPVRSIGQADRDSAGVIRRVQGAFQDISRQKAAEEKIRSLGTRLVNTLEAITDAFFTLDPEWRFTYLNAEAEKLLEASRTDLLGCSLWDKFPEVRGTTFDREYHRARSTMESAFFEEFYAPMAKWLEVRAFPSGEGLAVYFRDVTERRRIREQMQASEERFRLLAKATNDAIWDWDLATDSAWWNEGMQILFGYDPAEIEPDSRSWINRLHPDEKDAVVAGIQEKIQSGKTAWSAEYRFRRRDGAYAHVLDRGHVIRNSEGKAIRMVGGMSDVTERKLAAVALAESENRVRLALEAAEMGTYDWDIGAERILWSRRHEELWGYAEGEFAGTYESFASRVHPEDIGRVGAEIRRCMADREQFTAEFRVVWPDGSIHWVAGMGEFTYSETGEAVRMIGAVMEITERKKAVEALLASEREFRSLAEAMPQIVWITRPDGWTTYLNQHWMDYTGLTLEESLGDGWNKPFHPEDQQMAWDAWQTATSTVGTYTLECRLRRKDGEYRWWLIRGEPQKDAVGTVLKWFGTCTDIHDLKVAELEITRTNRALKLLSGCNEALIHAEDETRLLRDVCQLAVEMGGYRMAWVGYAQDDEERSIKPMAHAGVGDGYLDELRITWDEQKPSGRGPAGRTIRSGQAVVCEDMAADETFIWLEPAKQRGYRAVTCLPLRDKARTFGVLGLYSAEINPENKAELKLLQEMADDLAFGILHLRASIDQRRTHEAVLTMARGISASTGSEFFEKLTFSMVEALDAHAGFIARLSDDKSRATTLCAVVDGKLAPDFEYALSGTPCEHLGRSDVWVVPNDVQQCYPQARTLQDLGIKAYVGTELFGADGKPCGLMFVLFRQSLEQHEFISSTLKIFAARAAGELERQKTDARLREQAALLDKAQDAILVRDLNHTILYWNQSAERLYGWSAAEALGRDTRELIYQDTGPLDAAIKELQANGEWSGEIQQITKDGRPLTVEGHWSLVRDEQGRPKSILAINTDITERKKIEAQYLRAQRMESIGTLAGGIAHDLNNVLAPIMMSIELLKMQEQNPMRLSVLTTIEGSARRGADMVRQVLSFARGVEGQQLEVQAGHLLHEIKKIADETFLKNIQVQCDVPTDLWLVKGDPTQLHQVLLNLCVNARDAMPNGGRLSLSAANLTLDEQYAGMNIEAKPGPHVCIHVEDNGTGMPPEVIERIFEPFFTTKELGKGTGLGLSTTIAIIKSHGGFVRVYSEVGMGTRFHVYLPAQTEPGAVGSKAAEPELPRGNGELVLLIDDEAAVRQITRQTLEAFGYRVLLASDGVEATSIYATRQKEIDVVLTDMMMPLMDGPTTIQVLLRMNPQARIIAASGLNANGMVAKATNAGVRHFIPKPYTAETLLKTLREVLEG